MISKNSFILIASITLSASAAIAMEQKCTITIDNQLYGKIFLNVPKFNIKTLTNASPYLSIPGQTRATFKLSEEEKTRQSIAIPEIYPFNPISLPITNQDTEKYFTIKHKTQNHLTGEVTVSDGYDIVAKIRAISKGL